MAIMDTGEDKVKKICELLKSQTLDPAKEEANQLVKQAHAEAEQIIENAQAQAEDLIAKAETKIQEKKQTLESSLKLSAKQAVSALKQEITENLFSPALSKLIQSQMTEPQVIAKAIESILGQIQQGKNELSVEVYLPKTASKEAIIQELSEQVLQSIGKDKILLGEHSGGVYVRIADQKVMIDLSDDAVQSLLGRYISKHLQTYIFN